MRKFCSSAFVREQCQKTCICDKPERPCVYTDCHGGYLPHGGKCTLLHDSATGCASMLRFCSKQFVRMICATSCLCTAPDGAVTRAPGSQARQATHAPRKRPPQPRSSLRGHSYYTMPFAQRQRQRQKLYSVEVENASGNAGRSWEGVQHDK
jgi:hypothetical protein